MIYYPPQVALDPRTRELAEPGSVLTLVEAGTDTPVQVFETEDGIGPMTTQTVSRVGQVGGFYAPEGSPMIIDAVAGDTRVQITSYAEFIQDSKASRDAAQSSAQAAQNAATSAQEAAQSAAEAATAPTDEAVDAGIERADLPGRITGVLSSEPTVVESAATLAQQSAGLVQQQPVEEDRFEVRFDDGDPFLVADEELGLTSKVGGATIEPLDDGTGWLWAIRYADGEVAVGQRVDGTHYPAGSGSPAPADRPGIIIWGDSLTAGWTSHTSALAEELGMPVEARGNGGHRSYWIAARQGGQPLRVTIPDGTIPASGTVDVEVAYVPLVGGTDSDSKASQALQGSLGGVRGVLQVTGATTATFTRLDSGRPVPVPAATPFVTGLDRRNRWPVLWAGRNNFRQAGDGDQIVKDVASMLTWTERPDRALVLGIPPWGGEEAGKGIRATLDGVNAALQDRWPTHFVDAPARLRSAEMLEQIGVTPTSEDEQNITDGLTPASLRSDAGHLNAQGYVALNIIVQDEYTSRGWI